MNIEQVYDAVKAAVIFYPIEQGTPKHLVPQTFATLYGPKDFNSETLNFNPSHSDVPYFFSRKWSQADHNPSRFEWEPPVVGMANLGNPEGRDSLTGKQIGRNTYQMQLIVMDTFHNKHDRSDPAVSRSIHEIQRDCKVIGRNIMQFLIQCNFYEVEVNGSPGVVFYPENFVKSMMDSGDIDTYALQSTANRRAVVEAPVNFIPHAAGYRNLFGVLANIQVTIPECNTPKEWKLRSYGLTYDKG